ncbi:MAG TPA: ribosome maturation factor RimP [Thermoanaerobaculia bacterium]|jgi:ribosome maturation factor RimP
MADTPSRTAPSRIAEITPEIEQIARGAGCELVHAELKGGILRIFLDKAEGGVMLADCENVSRQVSALLDVLDFGAGRYVLEVSSPGLDRQLYRPSDYERFAGRLARVTYEDPETARKRTEVARLKGLRRAEGASAEDAVVLLEDDRTGESRELPLRNVKLARLEIEL